MMEGDTHFFSLLAMKFTIKGTAIRIITSKTRLVVEKDVQSFPPSGE